MSLSSVSDENDRSVSSSSLSDVAQQMVINTQSAMANFIQTNAGQFVRADESVGSDNMPDIKSSNKSTIEGDIEGALATIRSESSKTLIDNDSSNKRLQGRGFQGSLYYIKACVLSIIYFIGVPSLR